MEVLAQADREENGGAKEMRMSSGRVETGSSHNEITK